MRLTGLCKTILLPAFFIVSSHLITGCFEQKKNDLQDSASIPETFYQCGEVKIKTSMNTDGTLLVTHNNETVTLSPSEAASGSKYENPAQKTIFWNKGYNASFEFEGQPYPNCSKLIGNAASVTNSAPDDGKPRFAYIATGNEPPWHLRIENNNVTLIMDRGQRTLNFSNPEVTDLGVSQIYKSGKLEMVVRHMPCTDSVNGRQLADQIKIITDGQEYMGCGEEQKVTLAELQKALINTEWTVASMAKADTLPETPVTLKLDDTNRITGSTGCNRYAGTYQLNGKNLAIATPLSATRRACTTSAMSQQERTFINMLVQAQHVTINSQGLLEITTREGQTMALRK